MRFFSSTLPGMQTALKGCTDTATRTCGWRAAGRSCFAGKAITSSCSNMNLAATFHAHHHAFCRSKSLMSDEHFVAWTGIESRGARHGVFCDFEHMYDPSCFTAVRRCSNLDGMLAPFSSPPPPASSRQNSIHKPVSSVFYSLQPKVLLTPSACVLFTISTKTETCIALRVCQCTLAIFPRI